MIKIINKTKNGRVFKCDKCNAFHVEYKNLNFNLLEEQFDQFTKYLKNLDGNKWEQINKDSFYQKKIIIPIGHNYMKIMLDKNELEELKILFNRNKKLYKKYNKIHKNNNTIVLRINSKKI